MITRRQLESVVLALRNAAISPKDDGNGIAMRLLFLQDLSGYESVLVFDYHPITGQISARQVEIDKIVKGQGSIVNRVAASFVGLHIEDLSPALFDVYHILKSEKILKDVDGIVYDYDDEPTRECNMCQGSMQWCSLCEVWSSLCCVQGGTCQCS